MKTKPSRKGTLRAPKETVARKESRSKPRRARPAPDMKKLNRAFDKLAEQGRRMHPDALYFPFGPPVVDED